MLCGRRRSLLNRLLIFTLVLAALTAGCTDQVLSPVPEDASVEKHSKSAIFSKSQVDPQVLLSKRGPCKATRCGAKRVHGSDGGGFASPLFGLATAPNGDILVADAGVGVSTLSGATDIPLPGIADVDPLGRGSMWAIKGLTGEPGEDTGQALYRASKGKTRLIVDLFAFEEASNPDGADLIDSNPFDVHSLGGQAALVADAGANDLLRVDNQGNIEVLAIFPSELVSTDNVKDLVGCPSQSELCKLPLMIPAQPVPTSIAVGPDGYYYVGELKGFPAPTGASNIWRVAPDASEAMCGESPDCVKVFDGGFTSIIDLAFDANGALHVAELDEQSWFAVELGTGAGGSINACDLGEETCSEVATGIPVLTAITFGNDGTLWATKNALIPGSADVVKIP